MEKSGLKSWLRGKKRTREPLRNKASPGFMQSFELDNRIVFSTIYGGSTYFKSAISIHIPHIPPRFWTFCVHFVSDVQVLVCLFQSAIRILHCRSHDEKAHSIWSKANHIRGFFCQRRNTWASGRKYCALIALYFLTGVRSYFVHIIPWYSYPKDVDFHTFYWYMLILHSSYFRREPA